MAAPRAIAGMLAALGGAAALATMAGWLTTVSLQQDFAAYHTAGRARALGLDPYLNHVGTGGPWDGVAVYRHSRFLYPPLVADMFRPVAALPYPWAKAAFTAASVLALAGALYLLRADGARALPPGMALLLAAVWPPVFVALERGQVDLLLLPLLAASWRWRDRPALAGPALALGALGKPLVLGMLPLLLLARRPRWAATMAAALLAVGLVSVALDGVALNRQYLTDVLPRAARWGEGGPEGWLLDARTLAGLDLEPDTARVDGATFAQQVGDFRRNASLARALAGDGPPAPAMTLGLALLGGLALAWSARRNAQGPGWYWGGLLLGVSAAPVSWAMSLVWALPLFWAAPVFGAPAVFGAPPVLGAPPRAEPSFPVGRGTPGAEARLQGLALAVAFGAGLLGPWLPAAWPVAGVAAVVAATWWPAPERR